MKPSEIIQEAFKKSCEKANINIGSQASIPYMVLEIINYLDEECENKNPKSTGLICED